MLLVANLQRRSTGCKAFSSRVCPLAGCGHFVTGSMTLHGVTGPVAISFVSLELLSFRNAQWPGSLSLGHSEADLVSEEEAPDSMGTCGEAATGYAASAVCAGHGTARHGTAGQGRAGAARLAKPSHRVCTTPKLVVFEAVIYPNKEKQWLRRASHGSDF